MLRGWNQLKAILWKNWLLKRAHLAGFLAELLLPVAFMALLILIKTITSVYDSPNIAYYCGNAWPWYYSTFPSADPNQMMMQPPYTCTQKPATCSLDNYYRYGASMDVTDDFSLSFYGQYGYVDTALSSGQGDNPFYTFTVADDSLVYYNNIENLQNPSLPICYILSRIKYNHAIMAVAPLVSGDATLNTQVTDFINHLVTTCQPVSDFTSTVISFPSQGNLDDYMKDRHYDDIGYKYGKVAFGIVFIKADVQNAQWEYSIRANYTGLFDQNDPTVACLYHSGCDFIYTIPTTKFYTEDLFKPQSSDYLYGYSYTGFSSLQLVLDEFIMSYYSPPGSPIDIKASLGLMPTEDYKTDNFQYIISSTLGIFYMLSFLYPVSRIIRSLVLEKECRIKEGMKMMGLSDTVYNVSWLITTLLQMTVVSILITLITATSVFQYSNKFLVFMYFEAFSLAVLGMCYLLSAFFSRSKSASLLGPMIFFGSFFPYYAVSDPQFDTSSKTATCLLAPACFGLGANVVADYEGGLVGVQMDNINTETSNFTYTTCISMLFLDAVLYGVLAWYVDKVLPSEFGTPLPWYFVFSPAYWCGVKVTSKRHEDSLLAQFRALFGMDRHRYSSIGNHDGLMTSMVDGGHTGNVGTNPDFLEPVSTDLLQQRGDGTCVSIQGLRRVFKNEAGGDDKIAVHGLDLDLYLNQCTVLLGHNGAGKSTTISMLVGLIPPTAGEVVMPGGLLLTEDLVKIRHTLGVCPQHDILFPELTTLQHLMMFAAFKGVASIDVEKAAMDMLQELGIVEKAHSRASSLSGGQKRKLSLGMALIGDSRVVVLDEPSSGMDPYSRRSMWSIIQRHKKGRVILLTTHFMDEADLLGDRIAIMSHGKLVCCGSSHFLKKCYGVGYTLTVVKSMLQQSNSGNNNHDSNAEVSETIRAAIRRHVPQAEALSDIGAELSMRLPFAASPHFVDLFHSMDNQKEALRIAEYGISVTTLEEVFIRVGHDSGSDGLVEEEEHELDDPIQASANGCSTPLAGHNVAANELSGSGVSMDNLRGSAKLAMEDELHQKNLNAATAAPAVAHENPQSLFFTHFTALLAKRAIYAKRDRRMLFCQLVLPVVLVIVGLAILLIRPDLNQPDYILSGNDFNPKLSSSSRNFVPINLEPGCTQYCTDIAGMFNGDPSQGVDGVAVMIDTSVISTDSFGQCSLGAEVLYNTSQYLLQTPDSELKLEEGSSRYGAITIGAMTNGSLLNYNAMVNGSSMHGPGVFMNLMHQAYLQTVTKISTAKIVTHNYPLPLTWKQDNQSATASAFVVSLFVMIAICFIPTSFVVFVVKEREIKAKHQQIISGVSIYAYWMSTYLWDVVSYLPTGGLIMAMLAAFDITAFATGSAAWTLVLAFLLYGPSTAAITYLLSFVFKSHSTSQVAIMFFNFLTGLCMMIVSFILTEVPSTQEMNLYLRYLFRIFPSFCLGDCLAQLSLCTDGEDCPKISSQGYDFSSTVSPWHWDTTGANLTFMAIQSVVYFMIVVLIEIALSYPALMADLNPVQDPGLDYVRMMSHEDIDVHAERMRLLDNPDNNDIIRIEQLRKVYPVGGNFFGLLLNIFTNACRLVWKRCTGGGNRVEAADRNSSRHSSHSLTPPGQAPPASVKVAVQCLTFGVPKGECFGFLGINGAGKTTTLSILSGELTPTSGTAHINSFDIITQQRQIRQHIGYCPQFDALFELLTVQEHLELYARIKGLSKLGKAKFDELIYSKTKEMNLMLYRDKLAGSLSGGNKRKLSVAIATIGDPPIVFLDEPSSGMDPVARRFMWKVIARMSTVESRCSVMLTTHSMEEAEALCTRIGVMVNGQLQCLGSAQHLKHRFGQGYEVTLKLQAPEPAQVHALLLRLRSAGFFPRQSTRTSDLEAKGHENDEWEGFRINRSTLPAIARTLDNPQRLAGIETRTAVSTNALDDTTNTSIFLLEGLLRVENADTTGDAAAVAASASVSALQFAEYWLLEDRFDVLTTFLQREFGSRAVLIERSSSQACRYRIIRNQAEDAGHQNDLAVVFEKFEHNKESLNIHEYSVGQTTLEQIFNQFAAKQHNAEL